MMLSKTDQFKYLYLINGSTNLDGKLYLLEKSLDEADKLLREKRDAITIRKLHFIQLDIIAKLCSVIEDFLYFHRVLRENVKDIHKEILDNKAWWANKEAEYLRKNLSQKEIKKMYNFPDLSILELSEDNLKILREAIKKNLKFHQTNLKAIGHFWKEHKEIYNIFKHGCSIITGMYDQNDPYKPSHFYARAFEGERKKKKGKRKRVKTYMITCEDKILTDYDLMRMQIHAEFNSLLSHKEMTMLNPGKLFIPKLYGIDDLSKQEDVTRILGKIQKDILMPSTLLINIEIKESALKKIKRKSGYYIMRIRRDLMFSSKAEFKAEIQKKKTDV